MDAFSGISDLEVVDGELRRSRERAKLGGMRYFLAVLLCACGGVSGGDMAAEDLRHPDLAAVDMEHADMAHADLSKPGDMAKPDDMAMARDMALPTGTDLACGQTLVTCTSTTFCQAFNGTSCIDGYCWNAPGGPCDVGASCAVGCWQTGSEPHFCGGDHVCH